MADQKNNNEYLAYQIDNNENMTDQIDNKEYTANQIDNDEDIFTMNVLHRWRSMAGISMCFSTAVTANKGCGSYSNAVNCFFYLVHTGYRVVYNKC